MSVSQVGALFMARNDEELISLDSQTAEESPADGGFFPHSHSYVGWKVSSALNRINIFCCIEQKIRQNTVLQGLAANMTDKITNMPH